MLVSAAVAATIVISSVEMFACLATKFTALLLGIAAR